MGSSLVIVVFAVVVIGGMGSIVGAIVSGLVLGTHRGADQGRLSRGLEHRRLRHHGGGADLAARGPVRQRAIDARANRRLCRAGGAGADCAVLGAVSGVSHEAAVLRHVRLCLQSVARLHQDAVLRPRRLFRRVGLCHRMAGDREGLGHDRRNSRRCRGRDAAGSGDRRDRRAPSGHLFRDDHAGAGAGGVFRLPAGEFHRRREWSAGHSARQSLGTYRPRRRSDHVLLRARGLCRPCIVLIRRIVHSPFGQVLKAIRANEPRAVSLGYKVDRYKLMAFVCRPVFPGWPAPSKPWCWGLSRCRMSARAIPAK